MGQARPGGAVLKKIALLFPGQGSQSVGMGRSFFDHSEIAKDLFKRADAVLGFPLSQICFNGPEEVLRQTENTQPALYTVSAVALALLREKGLEADWFAGHSLGECTALFAAGVVDFDHGLELVRKRGQLMAQAGQTRPGAMAAILGLNLNAVTELSQEARSRGVVEIANFNAPGQIVISGEKNGVEAATEMAKGKGALKAIALPVSGAFHSSLLKEAAEEFGVYLESVPFCQPQKPVVSNVTADFVSDAAQIKKLLKEQLVSTVRWEGCVQSLKQAGAAVFIEAGSGKVR